MMTQKVKSEYLNNTICCREYAYREDTNYPIRPQMEDSHFYFDNFLQDNSSGLFAVLDGHGGQEVVEYCTKVLPEEFGKWNSNDPQGYFEYVFKKVDDQLRLVGASEIGSTCCMTLIKKEGGSQNHFHKIDKLAKKMCYIANLGDTRAVMSKNGKALRMTIDHKSSDESEQIRVKQEGGMIMRGRVMGQLAVTRAFGDLDLKTQGVSVKPDLKSMEITPECKYLIMASDGLWDVIEDQVI